MNTVDTDSTATDKGREKLLDRIRKLYAMGHENESSPHEAEIAMRRCQSLMNRFGITELDLEKNEFGTGKINNTYRAVPSYVRFLGAAASTLHDCICVHSNTIEFRGFSIDAQVAPPDVRLPGHIHGTRVKGA